MHYIVKALLKASIAILLTMVILFTPAEEAPLQLVSTVKAIVAFLLVLYLGKLLYDTLFFDRYRP